MPLRRTTPRIPGLRRFFRLPSAERDVHALVDDEIAFHVDMLAEQLAAEGLPPEAARREALRRFGNLHGVRRRCYEISLSHATTCAGVAPSATRTPISRSRWRTTYETTP